MIGEKEQRLIRKLFAGAGLIGLVYMAVDVIKFIMPGLVYPIIWLVILAMFITFVLTSYMAGAWLFSVCNAFVEWYNKDDEDEFGHDLNLEV